MEKSLLVKRSAAGHLPIEDIQRHRRLRGSREDPEQELLKAQPKLPAPDHHYERGTSSLHAVRFEADGQQAVHRTSLPAPIREIFEKAGLSAPPKLLRIG